MTSGQSVHIDHSSWYHLQGSHQGSLCSLKALTRSKPTFCCLTQAEYCTQQTSAYVPQQILFSDIFLHCVLRSKMTSKDHYSTICPAVCLSAITLTYVDLLKLAIVLVSRIWCLRLISLFLFLEISQYSSLSCS